MTTKSSQDSSSVNAWDISEEEIEWESLEKHWGEQKEDDFINQVTRGRQGLNKGFDNGLKTVNKYINGTHRGRYILIGADSGVGKTTIADYMYVFSLWMAARQAGVKIYIKYFSFEISSAEKKAKWVCYWIKHKYRIEVSSDYIMGRIPGKPLTDEHFRMVLRGYAIVEEMLKDITLIDNVLHPTGVLNRLIEDHYEKIGTVIRDTPKEGKKKGMIRAYKPNDPSAITVAIIDHMALTHPEAGAQNAKQIMDRLSMYFVQLRNIFGTTIVAIQQFSTNMMSAYREQKRSEVAIQPQRLDFGDSTYTFRDADLVFGLVKPVQFNLSTYHGFHMKELGQYFIALHLMKNRYGPSDRIFPLFINPIVGRFYDMPTDPLSPALKFFYDESKRLEQYGNNIAPEEG